MDWPERRSLMAERTGTRMTVANGNQCAPEEHPGKDSGPNGLKLSDRGWRWGLFRG